MRWRPMANREEAIESIRKPVPLTFRIAVLRMSSPIRVARNRAIAETAIRI